MNFNSSKELLDNLDIQHTEILVNTFSYNPMSKLFTFEDREGNIYYYHFSRKGLQRLSNLLNGKQLPEVLKTNYSYKNIGEVWDNLYTKFVGGQYVLSFNTDYVDNFVRFIKIYFDEIYSLSPNSETMIIHSVSAGNFRKAVGFTRNYNAEKTDYDILNFLQDNNWFDLGYVRYVYDWDNQIKYFLSKKMGKTNQYIAITNGYDGTNSLNVSANYQILDQDGNIFYEFNHSILSRRHLSNLEKLFSIIEEELDTLVKKESFNYIKSQETRVFRMTLLDTINKRHIYNNKYSKALSKVSEAGIEKLENLIISANSNYNNNFLYVCNLVRESENKCKGSLQKLLDLVSFLVLEDK